MTVVVEDASREELGTPSIADSPGAMKKVTVLQEVGTVITTEI